MRTLKINVDSNEQDPFLFPGTLVWEGNLLEIQKVSKRLKFGDYCLESDPRGCVVERKKGLAELAKNLTDRIDKTRFESAWMRFVTGCRFPVLVLDTSLADMDNLGFSLPPQPGGQGGRLTTESALSSFWNLMVTCPPAMLLFAGKSQSVSNRQRMGAQLLRMMLSFQGRDVSIERRFACLTPPNP